MRGQGSKGMMMEISSAAGYPAASPPLQALVFAALSADASIWLVQFIKAMRDERGEVLRNAHLLGFFRRICRLALPANLSSPSSLAFRLEQEPTDRFPCYVNQAALPSRSPGLRL